ncbi:MAG: Flp family type IVb pilin [Noviherbaspirillum sp.]
MRKIPFLSSFVIDERGAAAIEYASLASLIAAVIAVTVGVLGGATNGLFCTVLTNWTGAC